MRVVSPNGRSDVSRVLGRGSGAYDGAVLGRVNTVESGMRGRVVSG
jgi:hypothetical protein